LEVGRERLPYIQERRLDESEADEKFKIKEEEERCQDTVNIGSGLAELLIERGAKRRSQ
jgi:hypothetical protein